MSEKSPKNEKSGKVISNIIKVLSIIICIVSILMGISIIALSFIDNVSAGFDGTFGIIFHAMKKWYVVVALIVGGVIVLFVGIGISGLIYSPKKSDINEKKTGGEQIMGVCRDCIYCHCVLDDFWGDYQLTRNVGRKYYCNNMYDPVEREYTEVSPDGTCDYFHPHDTPQSLGYKGPSGSGSSGCYLTSALVSYLGKEDDCEKLTALRKFRDEYMKKSPEGAALVEQYYVVAPKIVEKIDGSSNKDDYYKYILGVVDECLELIKEGKNEETQNKYIEMVVHLKEELL